MAIPLSRLPIGTISGEHQGVTTLAMPRIFGSGSRNFWINKLGQATQIKGYSHQNATAVRSLFNNALTDCRGMAPFNFIGGGATTIRQIVALFDGDFNNSSNLFYSTNLGSTWTVIGPDFGYLEIPDFATLGTQLAITLPSENVRLWDGTTLTTAASTRLAAPTLALVAGTGALNGSYRYRIVPVLANGVRKVGSATSLSLTAQFRQIDVTWVADADVAVVGYEAYRTLGTDAVFYFDQYIDGRLTVTFRDNMVDSDLRGSRQQQEFGDTPPSGLYFCEEHRGRMWYGRVDGTTSRTWYFSDVGIINSVYTDVNKFDATRDTQDLSDYTTGGTGNFQKMFVIWLENSVFTVSGTGEIQGAIIDYTLSKTDARKGTVSHRTVARIPAGAKYTDEAGQLQSTTTPTLAYLTPVGDIRLFDGSRDVVISSPKADLLATLNYGIIHLNHGAGAATNSFARSRSTCLHDDVRSEVTWMFPAGTSEEPDTAVTWNYLYGVWYERSWPFACAIIADSATASNVLIAGNAIANGLVYKLWDTDLLDGAALTSVLNLKTIYGYDENGRALIVEDKRWRQCDILVIGTVSAITFEYTAGEASDSATAIGTETAAITTSGVGRVQFQDSNGQYLVARGARMRFTTVGQAAFSYVGLDVAYQLLPGLNRTFER